MTAAPTETPRPLWRRLLGSFWVQLVLAFVVVGCVLSFVAKPYVVPSGSMEHTLDIGDRVLVSRLAYVGSEPATGDVVVFDADETWGAHQGADGNPFAAVLRWLGEATGFGPSGPHTLVKRVIGGPGQTVACCNTAGAVTVDGRALSEPYVFEDFPFEPGTLDCSSVPRSPRCFDAVAVPPDSYLVLGDHRSDSSDSAAQCRMTPADPASCWRWAHRSDIVGKVAAVIWPIGRWHVP